MRAHTGSKRGAYMGASHVEGMESEVGGYAHPVKLAAGIRNVNDRRRLTLSRIKPTRGDWDKQGTR